MGHRQQQHMFLDHAQHDGAKSGPVQSKVARSFLDNSETPLTRGSRIHTDQWEAKGSHLARDLTNSHNCSESLLEIHDAAASANSLAKPLGERLSGRLLPRM